MTDTYLVKMRSSTMAQQGRGYVVTQELGVRFADRTRIVRHREVGGFGTLVEREKVGVDRSKLLVWCRTGTYSNGMTLGGTTSTRQEVAATAKDTKGLVRRARDEDVQAIADADAALERARRELKHARDARDAVVRRAFTRGYVVPVDTLRGLIPEDKR